MKLCLLHLRMRVANRLIMLVVWQIQERHIGDKRQCDAAIEALEAVITQGLGSVKGGGWKFKVVDGNYLWVALTGRMMLDTSRGG